MRKSDSAGSCPLSVVMDNGKIRILFVCLGNICRSPAAEGILKTKIAGTPLESCIEVDSAGTYGGHSGELPDKRMRIHAVRRGYELTHRSRKVKESDFGDFDIIIAMDRSNYDTLRELAPTPEDESRIVEMIRFCRNFSHLDHIPDPYYDGAQGFENVLDMLENGVDELLRLISSGWRN